MFLYNQVWCDIQIGEAAVASDNDGVRKRAINISTEVITQFWLLISFLIKYAGVSGIYLDLPGVSAIPIHFL